MRRYTEEEKLAAVRRTLAGGGSELQTHVANSLGMPESTLRGWIFVWKRQQRELLARRAAEENARRAAEVNAQRAAEENARRAAEEIAQRAAEENARRAAEEIAQRAAEENARRVAEENACAPPASASEEEKAPAVLERVETPPVLGYVVVCQIVWIAAATEEAAPTAHPGEASPSTSPKPEAAREPKGCRQAAPSSSSARKERASEKVCPAKDASRKRKRQDSGTDAEPRPERAWRSRRLREADERRRAADLLNAPEEPCKYKTVLEAVGLVRRPGAVDLPPLE